MLRMSTHDLNREVSEAHRREKKLRKASSASNDFSDQDDYDAEDGEIVVSAKKMQMMEAERNEEQERMIEEWDTAENQEKRMEAQKKVPLSVFQRDDGGFWGMNDDGTPNNEIYYVGIIDILQQYNMIKFTENKWKSWFSSAGSKKISALPPKQYARRFIEFITGSIK